MCRLESKLADSAGRSCMLKDDKANKERQLSSLQDDLDSRKSQLAAANQALHIKVGANDNGTFVMDLTNGPCQWSLMACPMVLSD